MLQYFNENSPLLLIGCGNMGRAMAIGWLRAGLSPAHIYIIDPFASSDSVPAALDNHFVTSADKLPDGIRARAVVLAVKPQMMDETLGQVARFVDASTLVVSVAAGVTLKQLEGGIGGQGTYARVMPNTPAAIGEGISGITAGAGILEEDRRLTQELMHAVGETVWIDDEALMDSVTAVSGSGPAYVFHLVECMAAAGVHEGLSEEASMKLARQTLIGAAKLLDMEADVSASELRERVTSPGGTTAAALDVLMQPNSGLETLMSKAIHAARMRGKDLGT